MEIYVDFNVNINLTLNSLCWIYESFEKCCDLVGQLEEQPVHRSFTIQVLKQNEYSSMCVR